MELKRSSWLSKALALILATTLVTSSFGTAFAAEEGTAAPANNEEVVTAIKSPRAGVVQITSIEQIAQYFPDENFRIAVFEAVKNGQDKAEGATVEEALANFMGDVSAKNKGIKEIKGLEKLRRANKVDLSKNMISDFAHLVNESESESGASSKYYGLTSSEYSALLDEGLDRDQGTNVYWIFDSNPISTLPKNFGGRLVIKQPGSSSYTYPEDLSTTFTYVRSGTESMSGDMNIARAFIEEGTAKTPVRLEGVSWNSHGEKNAVPFDVGWEKGNNETARFFNLKKSGHAYLAVGTEEDLHYWTDDELGTSTPGSQSTKYYLTPRFYVYDKVTINSTAVNGSAELVKTDEADNNPLEGAIFSLYQQGGNLVKENLVTGVDGKIRVDGLDPGSYYFKENTAPAGYQLDTTEHELTITASSVELGGGLVEVTPSSGAPVKVGEHEVFIAGPHDSTGNSPDITLTPGSVSVKDVIVGYASLNGAAEERPFATLKEAEDDINKEKNANNITGPVAIKVTYDNASAGIDAVSVAATNKKIPTTTIGVKKVWKDHANWTGTHPDAKIWLMQNGVKVDDLNHGSPWEVEPSLANPGSDVTLIHEFKNLPLLDSAGKAYHYSVYEDPIISKDDPSQEKPGYQSTIKGDIESGSTVTNQWVPDAIVSIEGTKAWSDLNKETRPAAVELTLTRINGGTGNEWSTTTATSAGNNWNFSFQGVPLWKDEANKVKYEYQLTEKTVDGYTSFPSLTVAFPENLGDKGTVKIPTTNTTNTFTNNNSASFKGQKVWKGDFNNNAQTRSDIEVVLLQNGVEFAGQQPVVVSAPEWKYEFSNLPKYDADGTPYLYSVREAKLPAGYTSEVSVDGTLITNTFNNNLVEVKGQKIWNDNDDAFDTRPNTLPVELLQNGKIIRTFPTTEAQKWEFSFKNLPKYGTNGTPYVYTVQEPALENYDRASTLTPDAAGNVFTAQFTNTLKTTQITGTKTWIDNEGWTGDKPSIILRLFNKETGEEVAQQTLTTDTGSQTKDYTFSGLPSVDEKGKAIVYEVKEDSVPGYKTMYSGIGNVNITNDWTGTDETSIQVKKVWVDNNNTYNIRPDEIVLELYQKVGTSNETLLKTETVAPTPEGLWEHTFGALPVFEDHVRISYRVAEKEVPGYTSTVTPVVNGKALVTNTLDPKANEVVSVSLEKMWIDGGNLDTRPQTITVSLLRNGSIVQNIELTEANNWKASVEKLPKFDDAGVAYEYTAKEADVAGYKLTDHAWSKAADGNSWVGTFTNTKIKPNDPLDPPSPNPPGPNDSETPKPLVKTGDGLIVPVVSLMLAVCAGGAALLMAMRRKQGKHRK